MTDLYDIKETRKIVEFNRPIHAIASSTHNDDFALPSRVATADEPVLSVREHEVIGKIESRIVSALTKFAFRYGRST